MISQTFIIIILHLNIITNHQFSTTRRHLKLVYTLIGILDIFINILM